MNSTTLRLTSVTSLKVFFNLECELNFASLFPDLNNVCRLSCSQLSAVQPATELLVVF